MANLHRLFLAVLQQIFVVRRLRMIVHRLARVLVASCITLLVALLANGDTRRRAQRFG